MSVVAVQPQPMVPHVSSQQLATVQRYALDTTTAQLARAYEYSTQRPAVVLKFLKGSAKTTVICGVAGAALGALGGIPGGPPGMAVGAAKWGAAGLVFGAGLGMYYEIVEIQNSGDFFLWKKNKIDAKVLPLYQQFIQENELVACPFSLNIILLPYKCKHGITFERESLEGFFTSKRAQAEQANARQVAQGQPPTHDTSNFLCPGGRNPAVPSALDYDAWDDCHYDTQYHPAMFDKLKDKSIENPVVRQAVEMYQRQVLDAHSRITEARVSQQVVAVKKGADPDKAADEVRDMLKGLAKLKQASGVDSKID